MIHKLKINISNIMQEIVEEFFIKLKKDLADNLSYIELSTLYEEKLYDDSKQDVQNEFNKISADLDLLPTLTIDPQNPSTPLLVMFLAYICCVRK